MKILLIIFLLTFTTLTTIGQVKVLTSDSDTIFWHDWHKALKAKIGLEPTDKIQADFYFRFWDGRKVVELKRANGKLTGTVTFLLRQYKAEKEGRLFFKKSVLTDSTTKLISDLVTGHRLVELPTGNQINGWGNGLDGITYIIEHANMDTYSFKNYWTPTHYQDKIPQAKNLVDFVDKLTEVGELKVLHEKFMNRQPFSSWFGSIGGMTIVSKVK
jgi:hypothetical protein